MRIVCIHAAMLDQNTGRVIEPEPVEYEAANAGEAWDLAKDFISTGSCEESSTLATFRGVWEGKRILFLANDNGYALELPPNKPATIAYLQASLPGTMHIVVGPAVALVDEGLW